VIEEIPKERWRIDMFQIASYETFQDGQIIFEEGSNGDWIYVVEEGEVEISKKETGNRIVLETLKEGDIFGEMAYIDKTPRSATATAKGQTVVGILDRSFFDTEFNKLSADFQNILKTVAFRLRKTTDKIVKT
jgi:CRP-like cAMP-binding protein